MFRWEFAILEAMNSLGGEANLSDVYSVLEEHYPLSERDLNETVYGRRPAYQHQVRSHISNLLQKELILRQRRGRYSLTFQGRQLYLNELADYDPNSPVLEAERKRKSIIVDVRYKRSPKVAISPPAMTFRGLSLKGIPSLKLC
jgi:hypothetical protein